MDKSKINPQLRKTMALVPGFSVHNRLFLKFLQGVSRFRPRAKSLPGVTVDDRDLGNAGVRIYTPTGKKSGAGLMWIHGGGLVFGSVAFNDNECAKYARDLGLVVVSVEYRLAPKHRFPAAIDDCYDCWLWMRDHAEELGIDPARIVISGQSAGGGLSAALAQRIHDDGGVQPAGQALFCPMLDDRTGANTELDALNHWVWNNKSNRAGWGHYLGNLAGAGELPPYAVPARREDLSGLPETWIGIGDVDLFYAESRQYEARLKEAGVNCEFSVVEGGPHAFELFVQKAPVVQEFIASYYQFLRRVLGL